MAARAIRASSVLACGLVVLAVVGACSSTRHAPGAPDADARGDSVLDATDSSEPLPQAVEPASDVSDLPPLPDPAEADAFPPPEPADVAEASPSEVTDVPADPGGPDLPDAVDATDATDAPDGTAPQWQLANVGTVRFVEDLGNGVDLPRSAVDVYFLTTSFAPWAVRTASAGDCELYEALAQPFCDPPCATGQTCVADGACAASPQFVSGGVVTITGLTVPVVVSPDAAGWYDSPAGLPVDLFEPGAPIDVVVAGDDVPGFHASITGVADMELPWTLPVPLVDDEPLVIPWTPTGDGARVEVMLEAGFHALPPQAVIRCEVDDAAGAILVPPALLALFPATTVAPELQHLSYLDRFTRVEVQVPGGIVLVQASSARSFVVTHP